VRQNHPKDWLRGRYDQLWSATVGLIREGKIELDSILASGRLDPRRGLTVIARPSSAVRQRLETAHMTVGRFRAPLRDSKRLLTFLAVARKRSFGSNRIVSVSLVKIDWYMSEPAKEIVKRYRLAAGKGILG
jgi:hypothetical protein